MWLISEAFRTVVASTPLVSIDLVVQNTHGELLLGRRLNRPAQDFWFVPGGRILKNETLDEAFHRLTRSELGTSFSRQEARLLEVYEHFYHDSIFGDSRTDPDTHYVVLGYLLTLSADQAVSPPPDQHGQYRWWAVEDMRRDSEVHENTLAYLSALS